MKFDKIEDYYSYQAADTFLKYDLDVNPALIGLRDQVTDSVVKDICTFELFVNSIYFFDGQINEYLTFAAGEKFPDIGLLNRHLEYLKGRLTGMDKPKYKAKYAHLLWESRAKHIRYAHEAVDNYLLFLKSVENDLVDNASNHLYEIVYKNAFVISQTTNYKKEEIILLLVNLLDSQKVNGFKKCAIMRFIFEKGKKIEASLISKFFAYGQKVVKDLLYPEFTEEYLKLLVSLCPRQNEPVKPFLTSLGDLYISKAYEVAEPFIKYDYFQTAMNHYKNAGDKEKTEEAAVLLEQTKQHLNFKSNKFEYADNKLQQWWDNARAGITALIQHGTSEDVYIYLITKPDLLPAAASLNDPIKPISFSFVTVTSFDINRNSDKNDDKVGLNSYHLYIRNFTTPPIWLLFSEGYKSKKLSLDSLMAYLRNHTWYGRDLSYTSPEGLAGGFDWLTLLEPSLRDFFRQTETDLSSNTNNGDGYILSVDSLVLKFEGLLREFSRRIGAQTIEAKENGTTERISFDKLLENEKFKLVVPENDIAFLKYLFTSSGLNLRNNIAHCFYNASKYSAGLMFLMITALLRLGNYHFEENLTNEPV